MSLSLFPGSVDTFKTIPTPTVTPTSLSDAGDDTLSVRLQKHSDSIVAVEAWLLANALVEPTGVVKSFAGTTAPSGYLLCNGAAVSRATFSNLFAVISTTYGSGDGATTFNVPNLSGSVPVGTGIAPTGSTNRLIGQSGGEEVHTLVTSELASHNHTQNAHTHTDTGHLHFDNGHAHADSGHIHTDSGHAHDFVIPGEAGVAYSPGGSVLNQVVLTAIVKTTATNFANITTGFSSITTSFANLTSGNAAITTVAAVNNAAGSGASHNTMQPYVVMPYIIKS